jgi:glucose/arabinose dehydrogenase
MMPKKTLLLTALLACVAWLASCGEISINSGTGTGTGTNEPAGPPPALALSSFASGLSSPVGFEAPNDGTSRIFVLEQAGQIRIVTQVGVLLGAPFLNITTKVACCGEMGLLGLAFHPNFGSNGRFFVHYTQSSAGQIQSVIAEYQASPPNSTQAQVTERVILVVDQPSNPGQADFTNHKGGQLAFGPDGFLYIALGDGGSANDPQDMAQNTNVLLGKILRIGVDGQLPYAIPFDNPFATSGGRPEIYAYGLRNPWRFSFDRANGRLFAGDVGQGAREEVDLITRGGNFGWKIMEGTICRPPTTGCNMGGLTLPVSEYDHSSAGGTSVIGGFVYRGLAIPALVGTYVFGDLSSGHVWGLKQDSSGAWVRTVVIDDHNRTVSSFGQDAAGELYLVDYANGSVGNGEILRLVAAP